MLTIIAFAALVLVATHHGRQIRHVRRELMSLRDDMQAALVEINAATDDIAGDITDLLTRVGNNANTLTQADVDQLTVLRDRLKGIASQYTPPPAA